VIRDTLANSYPKLYKPPMKTILTTEVFDCWFAGLRDKHAAARIKMRISRAELGNFGDCEPIGEGVSEMRIHCGPGYRVYFTHRGLELVILLAGGDKMTQSRDIRTALKLARDL
jgi:putative addiction module killer protein